MSKLLLTKKCRPEVPLLIAGVIAVVLGFALFNSGEFKGHGRGNSEWEDMLMNGLPFFFILMGLVSFVGVFSTSKAYISIYDDHIEGAGLNKSGFALHNFHFTKDMSYTVRQTGNAVQVICGGETYRIKMSAADASEVCHCVMNQKASSVSAPTQKPTYQYRPTAQQTASRPVSKPAAPAQQTTPVSKPAAPATSQPIAAQNILVRCPACNTPLKIPAGKGTIRLTCPKCKTTFQTES